MNMSGVFQLSRFDAQIVFGQNGTRTIRFIYFRIPAGQNFAAHVVRAHPIVFKLRAHTSYFPDFNVYMYDTGFHVCSTYYVFYDHFKIFVNQSRMHWRGRGSGRQPSNKSKMQFGHTFCYPDLYYYLLLDLAPIGP